MTKHKNYEWIVAWAGGKEVQYKNSTLSGAYYDWKPVVEPRLFDYPELVFRIKPEKKRTVGYRRYLWKDGHFTTYRVGLVENQGCFAEQGNITRLEQDKNFVSWLDSEWQHYEFEEKQ
jgi:hypothetical protein